MTDMLAKYEPEPVFSSWLIKKRKKKEDFVSLKVTMSFCLISVMRTVKHSYFYKAISTHLKSTTRKSHNKA